MLLAFLPFIFTDNIEIATTDFDFILIGNSIFKSQEIINEHGCNSVKISFPGTSLYDLIEIQKRCFYLKNVTAIFKKRNAFIRIDYEYKFLGLIPDTWLVIFIMMSVSYLFLIKLKKPFGVFDL